jgi:hypothetical protein
VYSIYGCKNIVVALDIAIYRYPGIAPPRYAPGRVACGTESGYHYIGHIRSYRATRHTLYLHTESVYSHYINILSGKKDYNI